MAGVRGPRTKMPTNLEMFDRGVTRERARVLKILRGYRDAHDEVCEAQQWRALDEVIKKIDGRPLIEVLADDDDA